MSICIPRHFNVCMTETARDFLNVYPIVREKRNMAVPLWYDRCSVAACILSARKRLVFTLGHHMAQEKLYAGVCQRPPGEML